MTTPATTPASYTIHDLSTALGCSIRYAHDLIRSLPDEVTADILKGRYRAALIPATLYHSLLEAKALAQKLDLPFAAILRMRYTSMPDLWAYLDRTAPTSSSQPLPALLTPPAGPALPPNVAGQLTQIQQTLAVIQKGQEHVVRSVTQLQASDVFKSGS